MSNPQVLCLGEILLDCLADQPGRTLEAVTSWTPYPGGAPANVACALVKLGISAGFIGCVGDDAPGRQLTELLQQTTVNTQGIQTDPAPTRQVYVTRTIEGDRTFAGFGQYDTAAFADTQLQAGHLPENLFTNADFLILGTLELAYPQSAAAVRQSIHLAQQHQVQILIDVNWRPVFWADPEEARQIILQLLPHANYLKLAEEEALWLWNTTDPKAMVKQLPTVQGIMMTAGAKGCTYSFQDIDGTCPSFTVEVQDTTGAGDAFVAGFIHQLITQGHPTDVQTAQAMMTYANAVGALTTTKAGAIAAQPTADEVATFLQAQP
ncbi:carbohydrate kinase family protein [Acaryochloris marina]|uniref:Fructokinase, putative n=1 Tax=Acaryochloris marina (strain MBIC 11017) TaxID=329726 RepID=B0C8A8_ACAM1|nr:carbohydrate kinase [Acaryochloris marina]ABW28928.1 fructokinase, putative [Acaryochloris marina MBIC11017]BDM77899.1 fructokinase [Acaryochloris marina MBIC10699]